MDNHEQSIVAISPNSGRRRSFTGLFKRELVEQTLRPDVSVAGVALANRLNTNLLAGWRRDYLMAQVATTTPTLITVHVVESPPAPLPARTRPTIAPRDAGIELRRGDTTVFIRGASDQAVVGALLRELLQGDFGSSR
ncbi:IS66-like element accessory protein TnpA [Actimicrobium sp. CCI2.3]|uniref:IS66-like element accessory protein TnpA n=1 Tax=Actimicrobium sp. CCI2.3 TaxID=3048616 RepID=UPI002AB4B0A7|nr:transposase [Actimicrobium sp. CCI2.3]MDY7576697.1 transposase [Actimicrobium sp. CCI2.3]MEB0023571.1 transposase [Actimicrobium sp. CCI2.3]